jgi:hypothetical protein
MSINKLTKQREGGLVNIDVHSHGLASERPDFSVQDNELILKRFANLQEVEKGAIE